MGEYLEVSSSVIKEEEKVTLGSIAVNAIK